MVFIDARKTLLRHATKTWGTRKSPPSVFCIHHSASPASTTPEAIARYHVVDRDLPSAAYHYIIVPNGDIWWCNDDESFVFHGNDWNIGLGVCLVGNFMGAYPTNEQIQSAKWLLAEKRKQYGDLRLVGHKEAPSANTSCPGDTWLSWKNKIEGTVPAIYPHINDVTPGMAEWLIENNAKGMVILIKGQAEWLSRLQHMEIIGRWWWPVEEQQRLLNIPTEQAADEMAARVCNDPCFEYCDIIVGLNEIGGYPYRPNSGHEVILRYFALERAFSERVRANGKKYGGGSWSTGNPDLQWLSDPEYIATVKEYYDAVMLHEYYAPLMQSPGHDGNVYRHHEWKFPSLPIYITECGCDTLAPQPHLTKKHEGYRWATDPQTAANDLAWYLDGCAPNVVAVSPYCLWADDEQWRSFCWWGWGQKELGALMSESTDNTGTVDNLYNMDFEGSFSYRGVPELYVADGWEPFWASPPTKRYGDKEAHYDFRPEYKRCGGETTGPNRSITGHGQQWFNSYAGHRAGIYRQIKVQPGAVVKVTAAMMSWHSKHDDPSVSWAGSYIKRVGIDPSGGTDAFAESVIWSSDRMGNDKWEFPSIEATANNDTITIFVYGEPRYAYKHNNCYVDEVEVVVENPTTTLPSTDPFVIEAIASGDLPTMQDKIRWWTEEAVRQLESGNDDYCLLILQDMVKPDGLMYKAENVAKSG